MPNEKWLIDYQKAKEIALDLLKGKITTVTAVQLVTMLKWATVDAVEVVRCENCENAVPFSWAAAGERVQGFRCMKDEGAIGYKCCVSGDDFCASGKRRTENADD